LRRYSPGFFRLNEEDHLTQRTWDRIEQARERWNVLRHPFYRRWSAGELSRDELARYSGQYRHAVEAIAALSQAAADAAPERPELRQHAVEERDHVALWDGFVESAGGRAADAPTPETEECVRAWSDSGAPQAGRDDLIVRLMKLYAIESGQPDISRIKRQGLVDRYGFADGPGTAYFRLHEQRDTEHAAQARELIEELASRDDEDELVAGAEAVLRANWRLLDGV
jgi:pyrroloquinoline quinone (PQQ) biosynthesis protein C